METHELIQQLCRQATPVKTLASPEKRFLLWMVCSIFILFLSFAVMGVGLRSDIQTALHNPHFLFEGVFALGTAALSGLSAFLLSVPGEEKKFWTRWLPVLLVPLWLGVLGWRLYTGPFSYDLLLTNLNHGSNCAKAVLLVSILPSLLIFWMLRQAAPLRQAWSGALALLSVGALGSVAAQFICRGEQALHIFFWHFCPCMFISLSGILVGWTFLRWRKKSV